MLIIVLFLSLLFGTYFFGAYKRQLKIVKSIALEKEKLHELNETKNELLSVLSHDLRASAYGLKDINIQLKEAILKNEKNNALTLINQNIAITGATCSLLDNMLYRTLAETEQLFFSRENVHLKSLADQVCYNSMPFLELRKISLLKRISPGIFVYADINSLKIALRNIVENAIKYTPENGTIKIYTILAENRLCLVVADNGAGMDPETLENLFSVHKKVRKKDIYGNTGTGLGLRLVKTMIEKNGGTVCIQSAPRKGTKVIITLKHIP